MVVSRSLSLGCEFLPVYSWSGRMGGPVEPLSGPGLQRGGGFMSQVEHREFAMMSSMLQG